MEERHLAKFVAGTEVFAAEVDTEPRLLMTLRRLARKWAHTHKRATLTWTARDIRDEVARIKKGSLLPNLSRYYKKWDGPVSKEKGRLELSVINYMQKLSDVDRETFFVGRYNKMKVANEKEKGILK